MSNCKRLHEHIHEEHNYPRSVKFCKVLVGDFYRRVSIPIKLVGWFKENVSEIIDLRGPSGDKWHVGLGKNTAGRVFLQYGWKEFVEDQHLEENEIIFFKYEGDSCFSVSIFDSSGCERKSSYFSKNEHIVEQEASEEYSLKTVEQSTAAAPYESYHCSSRSIHNVCGIPEKSPPSDSDQNGESGCSKKREDIASSKPEVVGASSLGNQSQRNLSCRLPNDVERDAAMQLARAFTPSRPSFLTVMKGYNVCTQFQLLIPPGFAREFLPQESQDIILRVTNEHNVWKVKYGVGESSSRFIGRWRNFARENNLKVGDVRVFELSKEMKQIAMMVHIFRALNMATPEHGKNK